MTGNSVTLKSITWGKSVTSSGKDLTRLTAFRTSFLVVVTSLRSASSVTMMLEIPSREEDVISLMPLTLSNSSSITLVTDFSTSSGEAPGYAVVTLKTSKSTVGNWSRCIPTTERTPIAMKAREKTRANFFCLTRKSKKESIISYCFEKNVII